MACWWWAGDKEWVPALTSSKPRYGNTTLKLQKSPTMLSGSPGYLSPRRHFWTWRQTDLLPSHPMLQAHGLRWFGCGTWGTLPPIVDSGFRALGTLPRQTWSWLRFSASQSWESGWQTCLSPWTPPWLPLASDPGRQVYTHGGQSTHH